MTSNRLEAFSDGVLAIIITIMVLEMRPPDEPTLESMVAILPVFVSYVLSFIYLGIYWNNHHHVMQIVDKVNGKVLWANLFLLFSLSLIPFTTSWVGEFPTEPVPIALYGVVLFLAAIAYRTLELTLVRIDHHNEKLKTVTEAGLKENISTVMYLAAIPLAFVNTWVSVALYVGVALIWLIPDKRIEAAVKEAEGTRKS